MIDNESQVAEFLDVFAQALESGDDEAADRILHEHPELLHQAAGHIESLRLLCQPKPQPKPKQARRKTTTRKRPPGVDVTASTLGDYQIHREIGRGGMGIVYEATQISLNRTVAVKVLPFAAILDQQQIRRFRNEAHAAASLHHSHIVPVFGVGCERGVHYYSMQMINGQSLEQSLGLNQCLRPVRHTNSQLPLGRTSTHELIPRFGIERGLRKNIADFDLQDGSTKVTRRNNCSTLDSVPDRSFIRDKVQLAIRVADALHYAHGEGVIHRDIKPSNLLIDEFGKIWIADFGLARVRGVGNLTAEGSVMGTIRYMSPEQISGRHESVDHRTDIYSLGITLYELLTLRPAFAGDHREQLMRSVETHDPVAPRKINPAITVDLETIVFKAIAKNKDDRYTTAGELADDLRRFLDGRPTLARRPTTIDLAFKWAMRRRGMVVASLAMMFLVVVGLAGSMMIISSHSNEKDLAIARAEHHLHQAHAAVDRFGRMISDKLDSVPNTEVLRRDVLLEAQRYYEDFIVYAESDPLLSRELATIRYRLGSVLADLGESSKAIASYNQAISDLQTILLDSPEDRALTGDLAVLFHNLAKHYKDLGDFNNALQAYRQAAVYQQTLMEENRDVSIVTQWSATQTNLALLLIESGDQADAMKLLDETLTVLDAESSRVPGNINVILQRTETRNSLIAILMKIDPQQAEYILSKLIDDLEKISSESIGSDQIDGQLSLRIVSQLSTARSNLATMLGRRDRTTEAIQLTTKAIEGLESATKEYPADSLIAQQLAIALNNHGQLLFASGNVSGADEAFTSAEIAFRQIVLERPELPQPKSRLAGVLHNRGVISESERDFDEAATRLQEAIKFQLEAIEISSLQISYHQYLTAHRELLAEVVGQQPSKNPVVKVDTVATAIQTELLDERE